MLVQGHLLAVEDGIAEGGEHVHVEVYCADESGMFVAVAEAAVVVTIMMLQTASVSTTTNVLAQPASGKGCHRSLGREADDALQAKQLDVLVFLEAAAFAVLGQSARDGAEGAASREAELDDDDDVDMGVHAQDAARALHLAELPVGPQHHLGGLEDGVGAA